MNGLNKGRYDYFRNKFDLNEAQWRALPDLDRATHKIIRKLCTVEKNCAAKVLKKHLTTFAENEKQLWVEKSDHSSEVLQWLQESLDGCIDRMAIYYASSQGASLDGDSGLD